MSNDVERSETAGEAEKAALEHAIKRCEAIQKRRDAGLPPYAIRPEIEIDFLAGVEWERERIRDAYCPSYVLAPTMENQGAAKLCHVIPVDEFKKEGGE